MRQTEYLACWNAVMSGTNAHYLQDMSKGDWYIENCFTVTKGGVPNQHCCCSVKKSKWSNYAFVIMRHCCKGDLVL